MKLNNLLLLLIGILHKIEVVPAKSIDIQISSDDLVKVIKQAFMREPTLDKTGRIDKEDALAIEERENEDSLQKLLDETDPRIQAEEELKSLRKKDDLRVVIDGMRDILDRKRIEHNWAKFRQSKYHFLPAISDISQNKMMAQSVNVTAKKVHLIPKETNNTILTYGHNNTY